uniref:Tyrosine-protein phosphatase domain-containing protein n=1 Tax=Mesocestoides corti TaxID=53468 RepID=A0A5K3EL95_MESCO
MKAEFLRKVLAEVEEKDKELGSFLSSLNLDPKELLKPDSGLPQPLLDVCAQLAGMERSPEAELSSQMSVLVDVSVDVETELNDLSTEIKAASDHLDAVMPLAPPSKTAPVKEQLSGIIERHEKFASAVEEAKQSNAQLHQVLLEHQKALRVLLRPPDQIEADLPNANDLITDTDFLTGLDEAARILKKIEQMQDQRASMLEKLRAALQADDVTQEILSSSDHTALFESRMAAHDESVKLLRMNLSAQENIVKALIDVHAKLGVNKYNILERRRGRAEEINSLILSGETFGDLLVKCSEGQAFYREMSDRLHLLRSKLDQVNSSIRDLDPKPQQPTLQTSAPVPTMPTPTPSSKPTGSQGSASGAMTLREVLRAREQSAAVRPPTPSQPAPPHWQPPRLQAAHPPNPTEPPFQPSQQGVRPTTLTATQPAPSPPSKLAQFSPVPFSVCQSSDPPRTPGAALMVQPAATRPQQAFPAPYYPSPYVTGMHYPSLAPLPPTINRQPLPQRPGLVPPTAQGSPYAYQQHPNAQQYVLPYTNTPSAAPHQPRVPGTSPGQGQRPAFPQPQWTQHPGHQYSAPAFRSPTQPAGIQAVHGVAAGQGQRPTLPSTSQPGQYSVPPSRSQLPEASSTGNRATPGLSSQSTIPTSYQQPQTQVMPPAPAKPQSGLQPQLGPQAMVHGLGMPNQRPMSAVPPGAYQQAPFGSQLAPQQFAHQQQFHSGGQLNYNQPGFPGQGQPSIPTPQSYEPPRATQQFSQGAAVGSAVAGVTAQAQHPGATTSVTQPGQHYYGAPQQPYPYLPRGIQAHAQSQPNVQYNYRPLFPSQSGPLAPRQPHEAAPRLANPSSTPGYQYSPNTVSIGPQGATVTSHYPPSTTSAPTTHAAPKSTTNDPPPKATSAPQVPDEPQNLHQEPLKPDILPSSQRPTSPICAGAPEPCPLSTVTNPPKPVSPLNAKCEGSEDAELDGQVVSSSANNWDLGKTPILPQVLTQADLEVQRREKHLRATYDTTMGNLVDSSTVISTGEVTNKAAPHIDPLSDCLAVNRFIDSTERLLTWLETMNDPVPSSDPSSLSRPLSRLDQLWLRVSEITSNGNEKRPTQAVARCSAAKNRSQECIPYDFNRVLLKGDPSSTKSDYINASHLDFISSLGEWCPRYILTQAPLPNTVVDFWSMIFDQACELVVLLLPPRRRTTVLPSSLDPFESYPEGAYGDPEDRLRVPAHLPPMKVGSRLQLDGNSSSLELRLQAVKLTRPDSLSQQPPTVDSISQSTCIERIFTLKNCNNQQTRSVVHLCYSGAFPKTGDIDSIRSFTAFVNASIGFYKQQRSLMHPIAVVSEDGGGLGGMFVASSVAVLHSEVLGKIADVCDLVGRLCQQRRGALTQPEQFAAIYAVVGMAAKQSLARRDIVVGPSSAISRKTVSNLEKASEVSQKEVTAASHVAEDFAASLFSDRPLQVSEMVTALGFTPPNKTVAAPPAPQQPTELSKSQEVNGGSSNNRVFADLPSHLVNLSLVDENTSGSPSSTGRRHYQPRDFTDKDYKQSRDALAEDPTIFEDLDPLPSHSKM